jgi:hypothetical protein
MTKPKKVTLIKDTRKKKPLGIVKSVMLHTKVTEEEAKAIRFNANNFKLTVSAYLRKKALYL